MRAIAVALAACVSGGCGSGTPAPFTVDGAGAQLAVGTSPFSLALSRGGKLVARTADPAVEIGTLTPFDPNVYPDLVNFDRTEP